MLTCQAPKIVCTVAASLCALQSVRNSRHSSSSSSRMSGNAGNEAPAKDMPAAAAFNYPEHLNQGQPLVTEHEKQHGGSSSSSRDGVPAKTGQPQSVPPATPTGTLQDMDTNDLVTKRNQILWDQAVRGQQPGLTLMQDKLHDNRQEEWGNEPTIMEPERQN